MRLQEAGGRKQAAAMLLCALCVLCGEVLAGEPARLAIVRDPEATGRVELELVRLALRWTLEQVSGARCRVSGGDSPRPATCDLPPVLVIHATPAAAAVAEAEHGMVRRITRERGTNPLYEVWFTAQPDAVDYAATALLIVEERLSVRLPDEQRVGLVVRVARRLQRITPVDLREVK